MLNTTNFLLNVAEENLIANPTTAIQYLKFNNPYIALLLKP